MMPCMPPTLGSNGATPKPLKLKVKMLVGPWRRWSSRASFWTPLAKHSHFDQPATFIKIQLSQGVILVRPRERDDILAMAKSSVVICRTPTTMAFGEGVYKKAQLVTRNSAQEVWNIVAEFRENRCDQQTLKGFSKATDLALIGIGTDRFQPLSPASSSANC